MKNIKNQIIKNLCYTELVYHRINKKLAVDFSNNYIQLYISKILNETSEECIIKKGKNFYVTNQAYDIVITINSNTFRVITVDRIK